MNPIIIDKDTGRELWHNQQCAQHCRITPAAWRRYHANGTTPKPVALILGKTSLWDAQEVKDWHATRPGKPGRPPKTDNKSATNPTP